tara:strand:- start:527 stop:1144 length:618 start_codon:yes stop_codon:yes gene_type:complete
MEEIKLTEEQANQVREQLFSQLDNFPEDKRPQIKQQIKSMSISDLEQFVKQNQLNHLDPNKCIFCSIIEGKTPSIKIQEDDNHIAVLEINPLTSGHTIIIPKKHADSPSQEFIIKVADQIQTKLNAKNIQLEEAEVMEHKITNIIPTYKDTDLKTAKRKQASKDELEKLRQKLTTPDPTPTAPKEPEPQQPKEPEPIQKLPPRIP